MLMIQIWVTTNGTTDIDREYKLREYDRLCSEIEKQLERRDKIDDRVIQISGFCVTIAGVIVTTGGLMNNIIVQELGTSIVLFACPILLGFCACQREQIDMRIAQINYHLRYEHEEKFLQGKGWETKRHELFKARPWFPQFSKHGKTYHELAPRRGLNVIASRGLFCTVEGLFILAATACMVIALQYHPPLAVIVFVGLLFLLALTALAFSWLIIEHKRHRDQTFA